MPDRKVDILLHPVRMQIINQLINRSLTPQQLAKQLPDIAQATLYRHLKILEDADILAVVEREQIRGTVEKTYALRDDAARLSMQDIENMSAEEHIQLFTTFALGLVGDFTRMMDNTPDEDTNRAMQMTRYNKVAMNLTDEEAITLRDTIRALIQQAMSNPATPDRKRYLLSFITVPDADNSEETDA
ncbi:MAG: helix-turn-helix domain-containing protein [Chloroflexota bacterium]